MVRHIDDISIKIAKEVVETSSSPLDTTNIGTYKGETSNNMIILDKGIEQQKSEGVEYYKRMVRHTNEMVVEIAKEVEKMLSSPLEKTNIGTYTGETSNIMTILDKEIQQQKSEGASIETNLDEKNEEQKTKNVLNDIKEEQSVGLETIPGDQVDDGEYRYYNNGDFK